jgi:hypothetical protein
MPGAIPPNPSIYHITHVANLRSIVEHGCLWSDAQRIARGLQTTNIGYSHIKQRRLNRPVTVGFGGMLGDYVPFNFCPRSVMLFVVARGHRDYPGGDADIVHLMSSVNTAIAIRKPWAFTDLHADLGYAMYFNSVDSLGEVDWTVMPLTQWGGPGSDDVKARRQAEFLVHDSFPWSAIESIGVKSAAVAARVRALLGSGRPPILVRRSWYY